MAVATTYPGVYIEEIPSGVHTITGVSTSITAFVGYTARGDVDGAVHIFSFADFERAFGGLSIDSPLSYCVRDFFLNGGTEAYVVRAAANAQAATVILRTPTPTSTLEVTATTEGTWGNNLQIDVNYNTANPTSLFNLVVTEYVIRNGEQVPARSEPFLNLSMDDQNPAYAVDVINAGSALIQVARSGAAPFTAAGASTSGVLTLADAAVAAPFTVPYTLNGVGPFEATIVSLTPPASAALNDVLDALAGDIATAITNQQNPGVTGNVAASNDRMEFVAVVDGAHPNEHSSIHFLDNVTTARLHLGINNGGTEVDGAATARPAQTGTVGVPTFPIGVAVGNLTFDVMIGASGAPSVSIPLNLWGAPTTVAVPTTVAEAAAAINTAITAALPAQPLLAGATAQAFGNMVRIVPGTANPNISFRLTAGTASAPLGLAAGAGRNVGHYAPGIGVTTLAQLAGLPGNNGTPPLAGNLIGNAAAKTGMYALENVDLFNLLVIPEASAGNGLMNVLTEAIAYCTRRRAFMIIDAPVNVSTFAQAQIWINGTAASSLRSRNAAVYFPRLRAPDPLKGGVVQTFAAAGALAGVYARTDSERGVWKAPAGTAALLVGPTGLSYTLTDPENGALNPLGLNCLRSFNVIGNVAWGARTGRGADALADEYKYIPVRRLALFLEESLYRGTQWAVFEPNDEPLWAQIRLNLGAFMHTLYALGAFQGTSPRDAYFVRCDKETTTQNDIDLGRVNIIVGFAPLKPAEFVIIQIQQKAGAIQT
jgi:phage tail sheath protein FI